MINALLIFLGSGLGGLARYGMSVSTYRLFGYSFPYGTLFVNVTGSLLMGVLFVVIIDRVTYASAELRAFLLIGALGGYTTFSTFSLESVQLIENGQLRLAILNMILSVVLCVAAAWFGTKLGRLL